MKYTKYPELKAELKELAKEIRYWKSHRKLDKRTSIGKNIWDIDCRINYLKNKFRHRHIAYCMLRGRRYEQIELTCKVPPNFRIVDKIMEEHAQQKTVCAGA